MFRGQRDRGCGATQFLIVHYLSDVLPILENFGLRVLGERPYQINTEECGLVWLHVFESYANGGQGSSESVGQESWAACFKELAQSSNTAHFASAFSPGYQHDCSTSDALVDIALIKSLASDSDIAMRLTRNDADKEGVLHFRLLRKNEPIALSDVLPILENFGLRVLERPYQINRRVRVGLAACV